MLGGMAESTTPGAILARNIASVRVRLRLQQSDLADRMRALGWKWVRQTVGEVENDRRRLTAEEILGVAISLETTMQRLLAPIREDKWIQLPAGMHLSVDAVVQLVCGVNGGNIRWQGNTPVRTGSSLAALEFEVAWPEEPPMQQQPIANAIVTSPLGVLVGRRNDGMPPWGFIGGEVEPGEQPEFAAVREVKEETGLEVRVVRRLGERIHPKTHRDMIYVACAPTVGTDIFVGDPIELAEVRWVGLAEADELLPGMFEPVREYLSQELLEGGQ
jgi:8-oxo-dGTP diphosphatase